MKLTKSYLKQLVVEELIKEKETMAAGDYRKKDIAQAKAAQQGLTGAERQILSTITGKLKVVASKKNLAASGQVTTLLDRLDKELDKLIATLK
mgnify:CR=1 FL=1|tara:strand:+ start:3803 stop:4081 length:279 start_codon:yes stop_codon:yes gene_type:complete